MKSDVLPALKTSLSNEERLNLVCRHNSNNFQEKKIG